MLANPAVKLNEQEATYTVYPALVAERAVSTSDPKIPPPASPPCAREPVPVSMDQGKCTTRTGFRCIGSGSNALTGRAVRLLLPACPLCWIRTRPSV